MAFIVSQYHMTFSDSAPYMHVVLAQFDRVPSSFILIGTVYWFTTIESCKNAGMAMRIYVSFLHAQNRLKRALARNRELRAKTDRIMRKEKLSQ